MGDIILHRRVREPGGRSKKTPGRISRVLQALRGGATRTAAAGYAGVTLATLNNWIDGDDDLAERVEVAQGRGEALLLSRIAAAGKHPNHWTANAWILERTRQPRYALRAKVANEQESGVLPPGLAEEIRRRLSEAPKLDPAPARQPDFVDAEVRDLGPAQQQKAED